MSYKTVIKDEAQELLTIFVETLTGKTLQVKVLPHDRVKSIKYKIQKAEGIPVSHQHLLYNSKELQDSSCVTEPSVGLYDHATVKLVLSLKGGPISLVNQAYPFSRTTLRSLVKFNREELEDLPSGCRMAVLVLRIGDQLNLLHVLEDVDDSNGSSSDRPHFSRLLENDCSKSSEENSITMEKVSDLKERMEKLSLQRKTLNKNGIKKEDFSSKNDHGNGFQPTEKDGLFKLPSIIIHGKMFKSRSEFSQVPILPDIVPQHYKTTSRDEEVISLDQEADTQVFETIRPKTCPGSITERQFYNIFSEDGSLHVAQSHYRTCISACNTKFRHEWIGGKNVGQPLNILPPITGLSDNILNIDKNIPNSEPTTSQSTSVSSIEKVNLQHRKLTTSLKCTPKTRKETQVNLKRSESAFLMKHDISSETRNRDCLSSNSQYITSEYTQGKSRNTFPKLSKGFSTSNYSVDTSYCELLNNKTKNNSTVPVPNDGSINFAKKSRLRCSECKKRLSLTSTFECRCGFTFCSYHRYAETHHCTYDFKKESRKMLEQGNPSVVAPKLPKI